MIALILLIVGLGLGGYWAFGAIGAFCTAGMWSIAAIIALIMGPKYKIPKPSKQRFDEDGIPYLD